MRTHVMGTNPRTFSCGHERSPSNTKTKPGSRGGAPRARCRICWNEQRRETRTRGRVRDNAAILKLAFWEALKRCGDDDRVHEMNYPYHDDPTIDGRLPAVLWEHMEAALHELRAGVVGNQP